MKLRKFKRGIRKKRPTLVNPDLFNSALDFFHAGRFSEARQLLNQVIAAHPKHASSWRYLAQISLSEGDIEGSFTYVQKALDIHPNYAEAYFDQAIIFKSCNRLNESITSLKKAIKVKNNFAIAFNVLGNIYSAQDDAENALINYRKAIVIDPENALFFFNIGNCYFQNNNLHLAIENYQQALALRPSYVEVLDNLGVALHEMGRFSDAVDTYLKSLSVNPENPIALNNLATTYKLTGKLDEAEENCRRALVLDTDFSDAHNNLGTILFEKGKQQDSEKSFKRALEADPYNGSAWYHLVSCNKYHNSDHSDLLRIRDILNESGISEDQVMYLSFAAGKILDDSGCYDDAFKYFKKANEIKHQTIDYSHEQLADFTTSLIETFDNDFLAGHLGFSGSESAQPVFIVGMPRSGTSLVEQIICSHSEADGVGEVYEIDHLVKNLSEQLSHYGKYPYCITGFDRKMSLELSGKYSGFLQQQIRGKKVERITDKTPANFFHIGLLSILFPKAHFIHCVRNPLDIGFSLYSQYFPEIDYAFDLKDIAATYFQHIRLMDHWKKISSIKIHEVVYEDLVRDFENNSQKLISFLGLGWEKGCLEFFRNKRAVRTASALQVRQPIYDSSVERWKNYEKFLSPFQEILEAKRS